MLDYCFSRECLYEMAFYPLSYSRRGWGEDDGEVKKRKWSLVHGLAKTRGTLGRPHPEDLRGGWSIDSTLLKKKKKGFVIVGPGVRNYCTAFARVI